MEYCQIFMCIILHSPKSTHLFLSLFDVFVHYCVLCTPPGKVPKTEPLPVKLFESGLNGPLANIAELLVKEQLACFRVG